MTSREINTKVATSMISEIYTSTSYVQTIMPTATSAIHLISSDNSPLTPQQMVESALESSLVMLRKTNIQGATSIISEINASNVQTIVPTSSAAVDFMSSENSLVTSIMSSREFNLDASTSIFSDTTANPTGLSAHFLTPTLPIQLSMNSDSEIATAATQIQEHASSKTFSTFYDKDSVLKLPTRTQTASLNTGQISSATSKCTRKILRKVFWSTSITL